jgi:hypothetical protein
MQATVKVFTVVPNAAPQPAPALAVEAKTHDGLRDAARAALTAQGHHIRALSFTPTGLVAYVEAPA